MERVDIIADPERFERLNEINERCLKEIEALKKYNSWMKELR